MFLVRMGWETLLIQLRVARAGLAGSGPKSPTELRVPYWFRQDWTGKWHPNQTVWFV